MSQPTSSSHLAAPPWRGAALVVLLLLSAACNGSADTVDAGVDGAPGDAALTDFRQALDGTSDGAAGACDPYVLRTQAPELLIGPTGMEQAIVSRIDGGQEEILLMMYQLSRASIVDALVTAHHRGVSVRVLLDGEQTVNASAIATLDAEGIAWRAAPDRFNHAHAKVLILDGTEALVMSGNFNSYTMTSERNYGVFLRDSEDLADLRAIFEQDWDNGADPDLSCTRLLVSPVNGQQRVLELIEGAQQTLDLAVMYATETQVVAAIKARAAAGVKTRVLLADPAWIDSNTQTASALEAVQIPVKFLKAVELHAKLIIADGKALVGSHNLSYTSLNKNREVGLIVSDDAVNDAVAEQFEADWLLGVAP